LDYALKPALTALAASRLLSSVFVTDDAFERVDTGAYRLAEDLAQRVDTALDELFSPVQVLSRPETVTAHPFNDSAAELPALASA